MNLKILSQEFFTGYKCDLIVREEKAKDEYADEYRVDEIVVHNLKTKTIKEKKKGGGGG